MFTNSIIALFARTGIPTRVVVHWGRHLFLFGHPAPVDVAVDTSDYLLYERDRLMGHIIYLNSELFPVLACGSNCKKCTSKGAGKCDSGSCDSGYTLDATFACRGRLQIDWSSILFIIVCYIYYYVHVIDKDRLPPTVSVWQEVHLSTYCRVF